MNKKIKPNVLEIFDKSKDIKGLKYKLKFVGLLTSLQ